MMLRSKLAGFIIILILILDGVDSAKKKTSGKNKSHYAKRQHIIKCCGKNSCFDGKSSQNYSRLSPNATSTFTARKVTTTVKSSSSPTTTSTTTSTTSTTTTTTPDLCVQTLKSFEKNESLFQNGQLINQEKIGFWIYSNSYTYVFGKIAGSWLESVKMCIGLGMLPLSFDHVDALTTLTVFSSSKWKSIQNFWTGGVKRENASPSQFKWCTSNGSADLVSSFFKWQKGQPDNFGGQQNCLHLRILKNISSLVLSDRNCSSKFAFACQSSVATPKPDACYAPICPNDADCVREETWFLNTSAYANPSTPLTAPDDHGIWRSANGRMYLFPSNAETWGNAFKMCCKLGMKLLSLDLQHRYGSLTKAVAGLKPSDYWTSGTDQGCPGTFAWCGAMRSFYQPKWTVGHPLQNSTATCVSVSLGTTTADLYQRDCSDSLKFICEAPDTRNATTGGRALQEECAATFNVSFDVLDDFFNITAQDMTLQLKCFIKCVGEVGDLWANGGLNADMMLALIDATSTENDQKLQLGLNALDSCSKIQGMDECDTAAKVMESGKNAAPDIFEDIVNTVDLTTVNEVPLPRTRAKCFTNFSCVMEREKRDMFLSDAITATAEGTFLKFCGKKYFLSNKQNIFVQAASLCCSYGLTLLSLETTAEEQCIKTAFPVGGSANRIWTSGSKWASSKYLWCPSGIALLPSLDYYASGGGIDPAAYLLTLGFSNKSGTTTMKYIDERHKQWAVALCEEP